MASERRSTGTTRGFGEMAAAYDSRRRGERQKEDIAAIDRGETVWLAAQYRGMFGQLPKSLTLCRLSLAPDGPVIRPSFGFSRKPIAVTVGFISAETRPFSGLWEAFQACSSGQYGPGGNLEQSGKVMISCLTSAGTLEFAVPRPDEDLALHYFRRLAGLA